MSNPWLRAAATVWPKGPNQSPDNMSSLANGAAKGLGVISPGTISQPFADIILPPWKITVASGPAAGNTISRYLLFSEDNTLWPGAIDPNSSSDQSTALTAWLAYDIAAADVALIDTLTMANAVTAYQTRWQSVRGLIGNVPTYCAVLLYNNSGVALAAYSAGNQSATFASESYA